MVRPSQPGVIFAHQAHAELRRGINLLADLVRPTLGPVPRYVAVEKSNRMRSPDLLDEGGTIARRTIQLPDPYADMGCMLLRHMLWKVHRTVGDGTATAAVLMQSIVNQAAPCLAAGVQAMSLRRSLERGLSAALDSLGRQANPVESPARIAQVAEAICHDPELAAMLGEIFDIVGPDGYVQVRKGQTLGLDRQYVEGVHWSEGFFSAHFVTDPRKQEARLENPVILISDLRLSAAEQVTPLLEQVTQSHRKSLMIVAQELSGSALGLLVANHQAKKVHLLAVKAPSFGDHQAGILEDLALLTGGRVVTGAAGERLEDVSLADLGGARLAWANTSSFGVMGGQGDPVKLRRRIAQIRAEIATTEEPGKRTKLRERLGRLLGGIAILWVGAATKSELEARKTRAERAVMATRLALADGVAPGGGIAYLNCQSALEDLRARSDEGERTGIRILARALEEPLRVIAHNGGYDPSAVAARVKAQPAGWGFDARTGALVDMWAEGILDPIQVLRVALETAVSGAIMALTTDVLVHHRKPKKAFEP